MIIAGVSRYGMFLCMFNHFSHSILLSSAILSLQFCLRHISRFQNVEHLPGLPPATDPMAARSVGWLNFIKDIVRYHAATHVFPWCQAFYPWTAKPMNETKCVGNFIEIPDQWNESLLLSLLDSKSTQPWRKWGKLPNDSSIGEFRCYAAMLYLLYCLLDSLNLRHCNHCTCLFQITSFYKHTSFSMIQGTLASIANSGRWGRRSVDSAASCCWSANIACWLMNTHSQLWSLFRSSDLSHRMLFVSKR